MEELAQFLAVSKMTVHRDLDRLQELRVLRKTRGGATLLPSILFEADYAFRVRQNRSLKQVLAKAVAGLVDPGMALIVDDSSTTGASSGGTRRRAASNHHYEQPKSHKSAC